MDGWILKMNHIRDALHYVGPIVSRFYTINVLHHTCTIIIHVKYRAKHKWFFVLGGSVVCHNLVST